MFAVSTEDRTDIISNFSKKRKTPGFGLLFSYIRIRRSTEELLGTYEVKLSFPDICIANVKRSKVIRTLIGYKVIKKH